MRSLFKKIKLPFSAPKLPTTVFPWVPLLALVFISVTLCFKSFTPNTYLTGWDTLHPEFNFSHAFNSIVWGAWRSDQGLGAIAAHSHMSELPRVIYLWLISHILPLNLLRYSYFFLTLIFAPIGMYVLSKKFVSKSSPLGIALAAFVAASYYLLNLGTVQRYAVPFEMFATQFAVLPWLFWSAVSYLDTKKKKYLFLFGLISFIGSSQAYAATLFYAFAALFSLSLTLYSLFSKDKRRSLKKLIVVLFVLLATNAYWILPNIYSIRNQSTDVSKAKINELFTPEAQIHNAQYGDILDVASQKNYLFSWQAYNFRESKFTDLLSSRNEYLSNRNIAAIPLVFAVFSLFGVLISIFRKNKLGVSFITPSLVTIFFLMNAEGPTGTIFTFLQNHSGLFAEGFRDPFTKFSILFSFFSSFYVGIFLAFLFEITRRVRLIAIAQSVFTIILVGGLLLMMKPAFSDGLVNPLMRISIPNEYFETFNWFKGHPGRVAQLPLNTLWGWQYNDWGYQGAGFAWFGIDNPFLTRDFDRWSPQNETFYDELSRNYYASDLLEFEKTLAKYNVHYLFLDGTVIDVGNQEKGSLGEDVQKFLMKSHDIKEVANFGKLYVYQTPFGDLNASTPHVFTNINANSTYAKIDYTLDQYGDYVYGKNNITKPFVNFDKRELTINSVSNWLTVSKDIDITSEQSLTIPDIVKREGVVPVSVNIKNDRDKVEIRFDILLPKISVDGKEIINPPIYIIYPLPSNRNIGYLSVEQNVFDVSNILVDGKFHDIGTTYVTTSGKTKIQLFSKNIIKNNTFLDEIGNSKASWCADPTKEVEFVHNANSLTLTAGDQSTCVGSLVTLRGGGLYKTQYTTPNGESPLFCLNQIGKDGCINIMSPSAQKQIGGRTITYRVPVEAGQYWFAFVAQSTPGVNTQVSYDKLSLGYFPEISSASIDFGGSFKLFSREQNIEIKNASNISVSVFAASIVSEDFNIGRGHSSAVNCNLSQKGEVTKDFTENGVQYTAANDGVSCDYFDYPQLLQTQSYLMTISGQNLTGRSLKFYLQNKATDHMDFEELLPSGDSLNKYIIEPFETGNGGYVINLETRSFGRISSENLISGISFSPLPVKWLTEIAVGPKGEITQNNKLSINKISNSGLFYKIETIGTGVFSINQAYEKGWLAIDSNRHLLPHLTLNGWENAWREDSASATIYVFYLPQLLEWCVPIVILVIGCYTLGRKIRNR